MKMIKKKFLELYEDRFSIAFTIALFTLANWLESFIVKDLSIMQGTGVVVGIVGLVVGSGIQLYNMQQANEARKDNDNEIKRQTRLQDALVANRQKIPNPYANIKDLSSMITNPYANLSVATQAADMQAEEADIALANTLDTLRTSGMGAGGATALAQAALRSKKGVAANIEQQEAQNARLRAQGVATANQQRMAEKQRLQGAAVSGELFQFGAQETREVAELDRSQGMIDQERASSMANQQAVYTTMGNLGSAVVSGTGNIAVAKMGQKSTTGGDDITGDDKSTIVDATTSLYDDKAGEDMDPYMGVDGNIDWEAYYKER